MSVSKYNHLLNSNSSNLVKPQLDTAYMTSQDRKAAIKVHNQKLTAYNNLLKEEKLKKSIETGIPQLTFQILQLENLVKLEGLHAT